MTPIEVAAKLPTMTKSKYYSQAQGEENVKAGKCKYLVKNRTYVAQMGMTVIDDLRFGAKGIDQWVTMDGGNAYVLKNYSWVTVGGHEGTQLHIEFDTMLCE